MFIGHLLWIMELVLWDIDLWLEYRGVTILYHTECTWVRVQQGQSSTNMISKDLCDHHTHLKEAVNTECETRWWSSVIYLLIADSTGKTFLVPEKPRLLIYFEYYVLYCLAILVDDWREAKGQRTDILYASKLLEFPR